MTIDKSSNESGKTSNIMEETCKRAQQIVRNPLSGRSKQRYKTDMEQYHKLLVDAGVDPDCPDFSAMRNKEADPVVIACAYILQRCGPKEHGYDGLKATSTGGGIKSAIVSYWRERGLTTEFVVLPDGSYAGNPGKSPDLKSIISTLDEAQKHARTNLTQRAYQETHEDIRAIYYRFVEPQLSRAIRKDPTVDYLTLQTACANIMQFGTVARGAELLSIRLRDLLFTGDTPDSPIVAVLPITKNKRKEYSYFRFTKGPDISMCALNALLGWLCVLRAHVVSEGSLFLQISSNVLQGRTTFERSSYARSLGKIGEQCGIYGLAEHSARRGGVGYHYFVLRKDLLFLYRVFSWDSLTEMLKYIGIEDENNSYALLGFTAFGTNELYMSLS